MGLLDDAIREHLELKRLRGADLEEVARQEDEALGDPRSAEAGGSVSAPETPAGAVLAEEGFAAEPAAAAEGSAAEPVTAEEGSAAEPAAAEPPTSDPRPADEPWLEDDDRIGSVASQRTAEFTPPDVEPEPERTAKPGDGTGADEDVLEETPEFLQETPEHDRLWFEQKPPRDFDFDS